MLAASRAVGLSQRGAVCSGGHGECLLLRGLSHAMTSLNLCKCIIALGWMSAVNRDMVNGSKSSDRCKSWNRERQALRTGDQEEIELRFECIIL